MADTSGNSAFDIWPEEMDLTEIDEGGLPVIENEVEEDAAGAEPESATPAKDTNPDPGELDKIAEELEELADGKNTNPSSKVTKGLQRVIAKKDRQIAELSAQNQALAKQMEARLEEFRDEIDSLGGLTKWAGNTILENLEDESRRDAELRLRDSNVNFLTQRNQRLQQRQQATPPAGEPEPAPWELELQERIAAETKQFEDNLREQAVLFGLKPENPALDYGDPNDTFNKRQAAFIKSVQAAKEKALEEDTKSVRGNAVTTRGANAGEAPPVYGGLDALERGARDRTAQMRKALPLY